MSDPKVFKGPEGYTFTLYEGVRAGVIVLLPGASLDRGQWIPLAELEAFAHWKRESALCRAYADAPDDGRCECQGGRFVVVGCPLCVAP